MGANKVVKVASDIESITVDAATFVEASKADRTIRPTYVNFFYGKNGTGKSTIARVIENGSAAITWNPSVRGGINGVDIMRFDTDYIDRNFKENKALKGVFTLGEGNVSTKKEIAQAEEKLQECDDSIKLIESKLSELDKENTTKRKEVKTKAWAIYKQHPQFEKTYNKKPTQESFVDMLLQAGAFDGTEEQLITELTLAYDTDVQKETIIELVPSIEPESELLRKSIVGSSETTFSKFVNRLGSLDWIVEGHDKFQTDAEDACPYCGQHLPASFKEDLASCFDEQYKQDKLALEEFAERYLASLDTVFRYLENLPLAIPSWKNYDDVAAYCQALKSQLNENKSLIDKKLSNLSLPINLVDMSSAICGLNTEISEINQEIQRRNSIIDERAATQDLLKKKIPAFLRTLMEIELKEYATFVASNNQEVAELKRQLSEKQSEFDKLTNEISTLKEQLVSVEASLHQMQDYLKISGFQGFTIEACDDDSTAYRVVREKGVPAINLSEGERNYIAFLYFFHQVMGMTSANDAHTGRIVVIDDPATSMDSGTMYSIAAMINKLSYMCLSNTPAIENPDPQTMVHQLFVLTHNDAFYRLISYNFERFYEYVSIFLVSKKNLASKISLCEGRDSKAPSQPINVSPVKNTYQMLWTEYREVDSYLALVHIIKQILEYYFIQIMGYEGTKLKETVYRRREEQLHNVSDDDVYTSLGWTQMDELLSSLSFGNIAQFDGVNLTDNGGDIDSLKAAFEKLFSLMDQTQHFYMMTREK